MTKLISKLQKVFGATGAVGPTGATGITGVLGQFGSYAASAPAYSEDIETIQALDAYGIGISAALVNNAPPAIQDINGLFYMISKQLAYLMQQGIPEWNADTTYYIGSFCTRPDGINGELFVSVTNDNINNELTDTLNWMIYETKMVKDISAETSYTVAYNDMYLYSEGSNNQSILLPTSSTTNKGRKIAIMSKETSQRNITITADNSSSIDGQLTPVYLNTIGVSETNSASTFFCTGDSGWSSFQSYFLKYS